MWARWTVPGEPMSEKPGGVGLYHTHWNGPVLANRHFHKVAAIWYNTNDVAGILVPWHLLKKCYYVGTGTFSVQPAREQEALLARSRAL